MTGQDMTGHDRTGQDRLRKRQDKTFQDMIRRGRTDSTSQEVTGRERT